MSTSKLVVPDIGDFSDVEVIEVLVKVGDTIEAEQSLITIESDKASMEIPASGAGKILSLTVKVGDKVSQGTVIGEVEADGQAASAAPSPGPAPAEAPPATSLAPAPAPTSAAPPAKAGGGAVEMKVPDIGDFAEVEVIEVFVKAGDTVAVEQSLITVESDKASLEIPSAVAGTVVSVTVKVGDEVSEGSVIGTVEAAEGEASGAAAPAPAPASTSASAPQAGPAAAPASTAPVQKAHPVPAELRDGGVVMKPHASPSVRRLARELGADLGRISGSAPKGRITEEDVKAFVKGVMTQSATATGAAAAAGGAGGAALGLIPWPKVDFAKFGPVEAKPMSRIKKISGANLHRNWVMIPHVTNHEDADITDLEAFRVQLNAEQGKGGGVKMTMLAFLIKACIAALKKFPEFNASIDGDSIVYKQYYHIGFAADTPNGLVVPVIQNADQKGLFAIATEMSELAAKARDGKLGPAQMQGGTFSISSLGGIGGTYFTPIINAPEVAILGVCRSVKRPVWNEKKGQFDARLILPLSLSWDHRVIDGAAAARFNSHLVQVLGDFRRIML
jgi:pyruvate dehydrogenase E2 component (dihydrolipoamide acetyltransferase)